MTKPVISVENLTKQYDLGVIGTGTLSRDLERWWAKVRGKQDPFAIIGREHMQKQKGESILALDDVSFSVKQGEALGIIGRNGAGKSTLLKILSRVTAPTSGVLKVKGRIGSLLEVGTGFHPELTGRENVYLNGAILGMKKAEVTRKFEEIVAFSGVEKFIDTPVKRYSSGMYVRLAFAVAAHLDPEILIVDEVLAVGDAEFQKKCLGKMGDVAEQGRTVLFVSHNMTAIQNLCENAIWLDQGKIRESGKSEGVIDLYLSKDNENLKAQVDLRDRAQQTLLETRMIESVSLSNSGELSSVFKNGDTLTLNVNLSFNPAQWDNIDVGFDIKDRTNKVIFASNTSQYGLMLDSPTQSKYQLSIIIPSLVLSPGFYSISLYAGNGIRDFDLLQDAIRFEVIWDISTNTRPPHPSWGPLSMPLNWNWQKTKFS